MVFRTRVETIPGTVPAALGAYGLSDLPFPKNNLGLWVGESNVNTRESQTPGVYLIESYIDRSNGNIYGTGSSAPQVVYNEKNGIAFGTFDTVGVAGNKAGYLVDNARDVLNGREKLTIFGVSEMTRGNVGNVQPLLCVVAANTVSAPILSVEQNSNSASLRVRVRPGDGTTAATVAETEGQLNEWFGWLVEVDYAEKTLTIEILGRSRVTVSFPEAPDLSTLPETVTATLYSRRGTTTRGGWLWLGSTFDLGLFTAPLSQGQDRMLRAYLSASAGYLNS